MPLIGQYLSDNSVTQGIMQSHHQLKTKLHYRTVLNDGWHPFREQEYRFE
jgi:hypothetical protein